MNKVYKVIYSKARQCYVVVSELAKNHHKSVSGGGAVVGSTKLSRLLVAALAVGTLTFSSYGTVMAAGPAAIENGAGSKAYGTASIAVGVGDQVASKSTYQGATSIAVGVLNNIDADENSPFDGVASSVLGQVNYTKNANAAIIVGAGNKVTNAYKDVNLDAKTIQELKQAYQEKNMQKVTEILQKAVPESGGQVMAIGGGNTVDYAQDSQVMGVSNTLTGTAGSVSKYNLVDGFQNNVNDVQHAYVVGTENKVDNSSNQVIIGDKNEISDRDKEQRDAGITDITIGHGNKLSGISHWDGNTWGSLTVIGNNNESGIHSTYGIVSGIVIGDNQNITGIEQIKESIAIGSLSPEEKAEKDARGSAKYTVGRDSTIIGYHAVNPAGESVVIGNKSQANSMYETVTGPRSIIETANEDSLSGKFASVYGAFNTVKSNGDKSDSTNDDGMGNSINGSLNVTANAQGTMIMGVGNTVEHSQGKGYAVTVQGEGAGTTKDVWGSDVDYGGTYYLAGPGALNISYDDMRNAMHDYMLASGGAVSVLGNSNTADYAIRSQILGTGNTLKGTENSTSAYNTISGFANTGSNIKRTAIVGTGNNLQNGEDNVVIGDYHQLDGGKHNVILGSMASKEQEVTKTTQSAWIKSVAPDGTVEYKVKEQVPVKANTSNIENAVMLGYNTDVSVNGGVALGSDSMVVDSDKSGKDLNKHGFAYEKRNASDADYVWQSNLASVSVGSAGHTRRMTNVAAGIDATDAVNVAQLKAAMGNAGSNINLIAGDGIKIDGGNGTYTISTNITGGTTTTDTTKVDGKTGTSSDSSSTDASGNGKQLVVTTDTNPTKFAADEGTAAEVKPSETLTINGDKTNIATKVAGNAISVKLKDDINVKTVTATDSIGIKNGPSMTTDGINAANKKITNVAAGTETTDAVNYGQLKDVESKVDNNAQCITNINGRVNDLDSRVNKVGAGAAALAALHPLDFDPDDKWDFAVGYGNYRDANSVAVGAFYRPDEDTMFSLGTNFGNGENMINAGVSFKFGQKGKTSSNRLVINKEVTELRATVSRQDEQLKKQDDQLKKQDNEIKELKDMVNKLLAAQNNKAEAAK
ncbi:ESPR-type extended signal peptide-containing protein [Mitsuokella sp.]